MNTAELLTEVQRRGIQLRAEGASLRYRAPKGTLTADLRAKLKAHKAELLTALEKPTAERTAQDHGLTLADLKQAAGPDWPEIENDPATLEALARAIQTRRMRERGEVPPHYTSTTSCAHCGPVPIFPGASERVLGCPWCFNRIRRLPVPRPKQDDQVNHRDSG